MKPTSDANSLGLVTSTPTGESPRRIVAGLDAFPATVAVRKHLPEVLRVPPISDHGQPGEIIQFFGGADQLRDAVNQLQSLLYAA